MTDAAELRARAGKKAAALQQARRDPRYRRALGRFVAAGLLTTTADVKPVRAPISVEDALWAGGVEPRILELLPAAIIKRPSLFKDIRKLPPDIDAAVQALRKHRVPAELRGIPGAALQRWLPVVGHRGKLPSCLKSFRLQADDLELLERLSEKLGITQTEVLRRGLRRLASTHLVDATRDAS